MLLYQDEHEFKVAHFLCNPLSLSLYTFPLSTFTEKNVYQSLGISSTLYRKICDATYTFFRIKKYFTLADFAHLLKPVLGKYIDHFGSKLSHFFVKSKKKLEIVEIIGKPWQGSISWKLCAWHKTWSSSIHLRSMPAPNFWEAFYWHKSSARGKKGWCRAQKVFEIDPSGYNFKSPPPPGSL